MRSHYLLAICLLGGVTMAAPRPVQLKNGSFEEWVKGAKTPAGWGLYAGGGDPQSLTAARPAFGEGQALLLQDGDPAKEIGIFQDFPVKPNETYAVRVRVAALAKQEPPSNVFLQFRFFPSNKFSQIDLGTDRADRFEDLAVYGKTPEGTKSARIYLYTHVGPGTTILLDDVRVEAGVEIPKGPPGVPEMVAPQYEALKDLHLATPVVAGGEAQAVIVAPARYAATAVRLRQAVKTATGVDLPVVQDLQLPLPQHAILLGNRSTNPVLGKLYDLYYTLLDLKYPGVGGYALHSLHNPYGDGRNAILVGGSDDPGVALAMAQLVAKVQEVGKKGELTLGHLLDVQLGKGLTVPDEIEKVETWEASDGYGSVGYFGWCTISKRMALYYMTGDPKHAREVIRLAFPDAKAKADISRIDGERVENKDDPLAGAYHYNQHMMVLYWDLIEESPVFTDAERLRVTNGLARQLDHQDYARRGTFMLRKPAHAVSSRHGQWAAVSLYCLGRYFQRDYPHPTWEHTFRAANFAFRSLHRHEWVSGENDNLYWYSTGIAPIFSYLCLSGDRKPVENGVIGTLLRGQEALLSGHRGDRQISYASLGFLHKAAHVTGDGRWVYYRQDRTRSNTNIFRVGQSFWPSEELPPKLPEDLVGEWSIQGLPAPFWATRRSGIPPEQSFCFGSFRDRVDSTGDFILLDGLNGASRNPYHTFDILDLRIAGATLLRGYHNQVLPKADGMVEPSVAMDAGLVTRDVVGGAVYAQGQVPRAAFCDWRRHLLQRLGRYALVVDELTFRQDSQNMTVDTVWQPVSGRYRANLDSVVYGRGGAAPAGWLSFSAMETEWKGGGSDEANLVRPLSSISIILLRAAAPGPWMSTEIKLEKEVTGELFLDVLKYRDRGAISVSLDGEVLAKELDLHAGAAISARLPLGRRTLRAGTHVLRIEAVAHTGYAERCYAGIAALRIKPDNVTTTPVTDVFKLSWSDVTDVQQQGGAITSQWNGPVQKDGKGIFFSLLATGPSDTGDACVRLDDRRAFLQLPEPAVASLATDTANLLVVATTHLAARDLREYRPEGATAPLLTASVPVAADWDFITGQLSLQAQEAGRAVAAGTTVELEAGEAKTLRVPVPKESLALIQRSLANAELTAGKLRKAARQQQQQSGGLPKGLAKLPGIPLLAGKSGVTDMVQIPTPQGAWLGIASGKSLTLLGPDGKQQHSLTTTGAIRTLHWWPETKLLLVGCRDEKLLAYELSGTLKWTYVSVMDPAVFRAAKTYWFKTAPGHEGIHGVHTGVFDGGKSRCFVGSACTLEVLDDSGKLVKRLPVFWGPGKQFEMMPRADGANDLLIARWPNGTDSLSVLRPDKSGVARGFYGVPKGHTMVGGWSAQNRVRLLVQDVDGDGEPELVSATNGRWNRVTVFGGNGTARHNAQFGPGGGSQFRQYIRDLAAGDLNGDGKAEILVAEWGGLVVALDNQCQRLWSYRCPSPPRSLCLVGTRILVGCDDGTLVTLSGEGEPTARTKVKGRVTHLVPLADGRVVAGTSQGAVVSVSMQP